MKKLTMALLIAVIPQLVSAAVVDRFNCSIQVTNASSEVVGETNFPFTLVRISMSSTPWPGVFLSASEAHANQTQAFTADLGATKIKVTTHIRGNYRFATRLAANGAYEGKMFGGSTMNASSSYCIDYITGAGECTSGSVPSIRPPDTKNPFDQDNFYWVDATVPQGFADPILYALTYTNIEAIQSSGGKIYGNIRTTCTFQGTEF